MCVRVRARRHRVPRSLRTSRALASSLQTIPRPSPPPSARPPVHPRRRYINAFFKELIDGIFRYAGDVIKFAGDALQVVWRNRGGSQLSLPQLVLLASKCCLKLLEELNGREVVKGVSLKLHMGIGAGRLSSFYIGGHAGKWEYFVAGEPIEQMSDATEEATHGELFLSTYVRAKGPPARPPARALSSAAARMRAQSRPGPGPAPAQTTRPILLTRP